MIRRGFAFMMPSIFAILVQASPSNSLERLNQDDQNVYQSTFAKCRPGTVTSALSLGFDKSYFLSGVSNWLQIVSLNIKASEARANARGLTSQISRLRNSEGFWLAMADCYGYKYGELNYGNLMKQIVDVGHLTNEVGSTTVGLMAMVFGAKALMEVSNLYPIASQFIKTSLITVQVADALQQIRSLLSNDLTIEEQKQLAEVQARLFVEPDQAIQEGILKSQMVIDRIDEKLLDPNLSEEQRMRLIANRENILVTLRKLPQYKKLK